MLIRLIIAVFGLVLVFALGSVALAGPGDNLTSYAEEPTRFIPNHPKLNDVVDARPEQPSFKKPASALRALPPGTPAAAPPSQSYFCDFQGYAGGPAFFWTIPDAYGDDLFNTRFTVEDNFECTLKVAHLLMYLPGVVGTPDLRVYLWDDDGFGFPGSVLDSVDISHATLLAGWAAAGGNLAYMAADFSAAGWVFADGAEYHYGWTPIGAAGEGLAIISDNGSGPSSGEERSSEFYLGAWGSMLNDWGVDYVFDIISERCCEEIPFSDCYTQSYAVGIAFLWRAPHPTFGDSSYAMRFDVGGPETLQSVDIAIFDHTAVGLTEPAGDDEVHITVYDDDGFGFPGTQLAQVILPAGSYAFFPSITNVSFAPLVLENTFHVAFSTDQVFGSGKYESVLSDNGTFGVGRSTATGDPGWPGPTTWYTMLNWWGADYNFLIDANLCRDEFSNCSIQNYLATFTTVYPVPDGNPIIEWAQVFSGTGGKECDLRDLDLCFYKHPADSLRPDMYTNNSVVRVYDNSGGGPGAVLHTIVLTPSDYAAAGFTGPGFIGSFRLSISGLNVIVPSSFFVAIEALTGTRDSGIRLCMDFAGGGGAPAGGLWLNAPAFGGWLPGSALGLPADAAMDLGVKVCCVPFDGATCLPPDLWTTQSRDFGRTGASNMSIDDAWCDLTTSWLYETPANSIPNSPIVHNGRVYISTSAPSGDASTIEVLDLISGANLFTISDLDFGNFILNDPTIIGDLLYVSGGDKRTITAWDISGVPTKVMSRSFGGVVGPLRFGNTIVLNIGGSDVVFAASEVGRVVAIDAVTGADYGGWASNPLTLNAGQRIGGSASDGVSLYYVTRIGGLNGDVYSVDATTGTINWQLSSAGGLQGIDVYGSVSPITPISEGFTNVSYDAGKLFVGSRMTGDFPRDGVYYTLNAASGSVINRIATNGFILSNPIVDINLVYLQTFTRWIGGNAVLGNNLIAASKNTGAQVWQSEDIYDNLDNGLFTGNGVRSCEPEPVQDILINTDTEGAISFWNTITGEQLFRRRWDFGQDISGGTAATIAADNTGATHVLVSNGFGAVVDLVKGADRPRLEIQDYDPEISVEFSVAVSELKTLTNGLVNTGCADLTFNAVNVDTVSNGSSDPDIVSTNVIRPELLDRSTDLANQLASSASLFKGIEEANIFNVAGELSLVSVRELAQNNNRFIGRSATALPAYLNGIVQPFSGQILAGGDSLDIVLDVNPANINRGPQIFYIELDTDDPDFFVNASGGFLPSPFPEIQITLVGGCLTDTSTLLFGVGGDDLVLVTNTTRLAEGDWSPFGFQYNGEGGYMFQGTYVFGVSTERIAMNVSSWVSGQGEFESWISVQADPNWCDNRCKPAIITGVNFGRIWDGADYQLILGNMICVSWIDSVQDFSLFAGAGIDPDPAAWDWDNFGAPFDDSLTMGVSANTRTLGVEGVAEFGNFTIEIFEVTNRSATDGIPDWKFGSMIDYDAAHFVFQTGNDTLVYDRDISATWTTEASGGVDFAFGQFKLPFGCGYEPMVNAMSLDSDQGHFTTGGRGDPYWDSAYFYLSLPPGTVRGHNVSAAPRDEQSHSTIIWHDFAPSETITFGVVNFGFDAGVTDPLAPGGGGEIAALAYFTNKMAGFGRGDVDNDNNITIADIMTIVGIVNGTVPGAIPFEHLADVDGDGAVDAADVTYLVDYYFFHGECPRGDWTL